MFLRHIFIFVRCKRLKSFCKKNKKFKTGLMTSFILPLEPTKSGYTYIGKKNAKQSSFTVSCLGNSFVLFLPSLVRSYVETLALYLGILGKLK